METSKIFKLTSENQNTLFIIPAGTAAERSHSVKYRFKVRSDFFYLAQIAMSEAYVVAFNDQAFIYRIAPDAQAEVWGEFHFDESQKSTLDLQIGTLENFFQLISKLAIKALQIALPLGRDQMLDRYINELVTYQGRSSHNLIRLVDSTLLIGKLRARKETHEIAYLKKAFELSLRAHELIANQDFIGRREIDVCNLIESEFLKAGMTWPSYETIVGSGIRTTVLHARATHKVICDGELILIDAGAEVEGYCADITRTFAANGKMTLEQKNIIDLVSETQKRVIERIRPGMAFSEIDEFAKLILKSGLQKILKTDEINMKDFMPHGTSHWIGLDVHDPCPYLDEKGESVRLQEGMTMTIEPGCYFSADLAKKFPHYAGIGVRIEDDIVIGKNGAEVLYAGHEVERSHNLLF